MSTNDEIFHQVEIWKVEVSENKNFCEVCHFRFNEIRVYICVYIINVIYECTGNAFFVSVSQITLTLVKRNIKLYINPRPDAQ